MNVLCRNVILLGASLASLPAAAGPYDEPYALVQSARRHPARGVEPATVIRVDDEHARPGRHLPVSPGVHVVEVSVPGHGVGRSERRTLVLELRPCTRYYLGAHRPSRASREWEAYVEFAEPIGECQAAAQRARAEFR